MKELTKIASRQDTNFKLSPSSSNETSINLSNEISALISDESGEVTFTIYKTDFVKAISALCLIPNVYNKKETKATEPASIIACLYPTINAQFGDSETSEYAINILKRDDGRAYFNNLKLPNGFNLRAFLVEQLSALTFIKNDDGKLSIRLETSLPDESVEHVEVQHSFDKLPLDEPLQQIFFGAPGTGKSFRINEMCAEYENYRTTFHPDTDYASFVGSYKPITKRVPQYDIYHNVIIDKETNKPVMEDRIVYRYVFQSFLKAYIAAWREQQNEQPKPVFLVVEEINRGNCAQIFGDIFQLLDRNEAGYSDYPIVADDDLAQELKREFAGLNISNADGINALYKGGKDVVGSVKSGARLLLPNNLYIWATMNTSDQSLFPIDSAFKRRWDWKYIKIKDNAKDYKIVFTNGNEYDWWQFVIAINERIEGGEIQQEDKKLGYFFAKSKNGIITAERFLSKVIFFLYNDVFKDFGFDEDYFKGTDGQPMTFASYFDESGEANEDQIERFLTNLGLEPITVPEDIEDSLVEEANNDDSDTPNAKRGPRRTFKVVMRDGVVISARKAADALIKFVEYVGIEKVKAMDIRSHNGVAFISTPKDPAFSTWHTRYKHRIQNTEYYINSAWSVDDMVNKLVKRITDFYGLATENISIINQSDYAE